MFLVRLLSTADSYLILLHSKQEKVNRAEATRSRGADSARGPSERGTTSSRSSLVFHLCVFLLFYHSLLFTVSFFIQSKHHCCAIFQILFKVYFLLSVFFDLYPSRCLACRHCSVPSFSLCFSFCPHLTPPSPVHVSHRVSYSFTPSCFCYSNASDHLHRNAT